VLVGLFPFLHALEHFTRCEVVGVSDKGVFVAVVVVDPDGSLLFVVKKIEGSHFITGPEDMIGVSGFGSRVQDTMVDRSIGRPPKGGELETRFLLEMPANAVEFEDE